MSHDAVGHIHLIAAFAALLTGGWVLLIPKGTRWHRTLGHLYLTSMIVVNATALAIYRLTGSFGPFHFFALVGFVALALAMGTVLLRRPRGRWIEAHGSWMAGSYMGLAAAFIAETSTRLLLPIVAERTEGGSIWIAFWTLVAAATALSIGAGVWLMRTRMEAAVRKTPQAMRAERDRLRQTRHGELRGDTAV